MVRIPSSSTLTVEQTVAFPEPNHAPELTAQLHYKVLRVGGVDPWAGVDDVIVAPPRVVVDRQGSVQPSRAHSSLCVVPSHQDWVVEKYGAPRDYASGQGCVLKGSRADVDAVVDVDEDGGE